MWAIFVAAYVPEFWQGWAMTFDFNWSTLFIPMVWTQALLWVFWRSSLGAGLGTAFASYLPRGGDINASVIINTISDALAIFIAAMALPSLLLGVAIPPLFAGSFGLVFSGLPQVWNALGDPGLFLATFFYFISIPAAFPVLMASWEAWNVALMDKFGLPRGRIITLTTILGAILSAIYALPIYDALNGESWGLTLIFTQWYWGPVLLGFGLIIEYAMLFYYFKPEKVIDTINEGSAVKLPRSFRYVFYVTFAIVLFVMAYLIVDTTGVVPGVDPGSAGTVLGDGTAFYGLSLEGGLILAFLLGLPLFICLWLSKE